MNFRVCRLKVEYQSLKKDKVAFDAVVYFDQRMYQSLKKDKVEEYCEEIRVFEKYQSLKKDKVVEHLVPLTV